MFRSGAGGFGVWVMAEDPVYAAEVEDHSEGTDDGGPDAPADECVGAATEAGGGEERIAGGRTDAEAAGRDREAIGHESERDDESHAEIESGGIDGHDREDGTDEHERISDERDKKGQADSAQMGAIAADSANHVGVPLAPGEDAER